MRRESGGVREEVLTSLQVTAMSVLIFCVSVGTVAIGMPLFMRSKMFDQPPTYGRPSSGPDVDKTWRPIRDRLQRRTETFRFVTLCVCIPAAAVALLVLIVT